MNLNSVYSEIKELLSIPNEDYGLEQIINSYFKSESDECKLEILGDILSFINKFSMFNDNKLFMSSLYRCIINTLELMLDSIYDFEEILIKNAIMHFSQEYINYFKIDKKEQVLKLLVKSLEKLEFQPLVTNLRLLLYPIYHTQKNIYSLNGLKELEVDYDLTDNNEILLKSEIDIWLKSKNIDLNQQEKLKRKLRYKFDKLVTKYSIKKNSMKYNKLLIEAKEMLIMHLTVISLMDHIEDDSFEPIPIK